MFLFKYLLVSVLACCVNSGMNSNENSDIVQSQVETEENESGTSQAVQEDVLGESIVTNGGEVIALTSLELRVEASDAVVYYASDISA